MPLFLVLLALCGTMLGGYASAAPSCSEGTPNCGEVAPAAERPLLPNEGAIVARFVAPGADRQLVPDGMAFFQGKLLVGTFPGADSKETSCVVFRLDQNTGAVLNEFPVPECAGMSTVVTAGKQIYVLWKNGLAVLSGREATFGKVTKTVRLGAGLSGRHALARAGMIYIGTPTPSECEIFYGFETGVIGKLRTKEITLDLMGSLAPPTKRICRAGAATMDFWGRAWFIEEGSKFAKLSNEDDIKSRVSRSTAGIAVDWEDLVWTAIRADKEGPEQPLIVRYDPAKLK